MENFSDIVGDESQVLGKVFLLQLQHLPARKIGMPPVMKRRIIPDGFRKGRKEMRCPSQWIQRRRQYFH